MDYFEKIHLGNTSKIHRPMDYFAENTSGKYTGKYIKKYIDQWIILKKIHLKKIHPKNPSPDGFFRWTFLK